MYRKSNKFLYETWLFLESFINVTEVEKRHERERERQQRGQWYSVAAEVIGWGWIRP